MEEEYIVNDGQADNLWRSVKKTLKCAKGREGSVTRCEGCTDDHDTSQKLGPKEYRKTVNC